MNSYWDIEKLIGRIVRLFNASSDAAESSNTRALEFNLNSSVLFLNLATTWGMSKTMEKKSEIDFFFLSYRLRQSTINDLVLKKTLKSF